MPLKLFLDADLILLKLEAQALNNVDVPRPVLGVPLQESMPTLAAQLLDAIQRNFLMQTPDAKFALHDLGEINIVHQGYVWGFKCWSFLGAVRKGFYLEGCPMTGMMVESAGLHSHEFEEIRHLQALAELAGLPILQLDARWHTVYANEALCRLYGKTLDDLSLHDWLDMFHDDDQADYLESLFRHSKSSMAFQVELRFRDIRGQVLTVLTHNQPVFNTSGMLDSVIILLLKVNKLSAMNNRHPLLKDALTGLDNRYGFLQVLENELKRFFNKSQLAVLYVDIDGLKRVSEVYGHTASDNLLKALSKRLKGVLRGADLLTRLSDDEFVILVHDVGEENECIAIANKLLAVVSDNHAIQEDASASHLTASIGIRVYSGNEFIQSSIASEVDIKKLSSRILEQSEAAMYQAKITGHNHYHFYSMDSEAQGQQSMELSNALHRAVEMDEFELYYQPLLDLNSLHLYGYEGLIRWPGSPWKTERFIQALEDSHLIHRMGRWVVKRSIQQFSQLLKQDTGVDQPPPILSINISPLQFYEADLVSFISSILQQYGVQPQLVTLEITERLLSDNSVDVEGRLREMKKLGLLIALDDFGTGYSSLSYLHQFPIDVIKIDQSFVKDIERYESLQIVDAIVNLGRALNKVTLAEGVETEQQLALLRKSQCQVIQGWVYSSVVSFVGLRHFYTNQKEALAKLKCLSD